MTRIEMQSVLEWAGLENQPPRGMKLCVPRACNQYDGTLASHDTLSKPVQRALERLRTSGRRAILVTGRRLDAPAPGDRTG